MCVLQMFTLFISLHTSCMYTRNRSPIFCFRMNHFEDNSVVFQMIGIETRQNGSKGSFFMGSVSLLLTHHPSKLRQATLRSFCAWPRVRILLGRCVCFFLTVTKKNVFQCALQGSPGFLREKKPSNEILKMRNINVCNGSIQSLEKKDDLGKLNSLQNF